MMWWCSCSDRVECLYWQCVALSPAALAFFNVFTVRSEESEAGIQVFDSSGNPVGISKAAGHKVRIGEHMDKVCVLNEKSKYCRVFFLSRLWRKPRCREQHCLVQLLLFLICWFCFYRGESLFYLPGQNVAPVGLNQLDFTSQNKTFPEEPSSDCSFPPHKRSICSGPDDPCVVQSLSTAGNGKIQDPLLCRDVFLVLNSNWPWACFTDKEGDVRGGSAGCSSRRTFILSQRTLRYSFIK